MGNFSRDPVPGDRVLQVSMVNPRGDCSSSNINIEIVAEDNPTTMEIATNRLLFRQMCAASLPLQRRKYVSLPILRPCLGVKVDDVDTDRFVGGYIECVISPSSGMQKGDLLVWACPVATTREQSNSMDPSTVHVFMKDNSEKAVMFEHRQVASIVKGIVLDHPGTQRREALESLVATVDDDELEAVSLLFTQDGSASIACCSKALEAVGWTSTLWRPREGERQVDIFLQPGHSIPRQSVDTFKNKNLVSLMNSDSTNNKQLDPPLEDKITIRITPEFFEVSQLTLQYREGSGTVRLAPFELLSDTLGYECSEYSRGFIMLEIIEGGTVHDSICMRDSSDLRLIKRDEKDDVDKSEESCTPGSRLKASVAGVIAVQKTRHSLVGFLGDTPRAVKIEPKVSFCGPLSTKERIQTKISQQARANLALRDFIVTSTQQSVLQRLQLKRRETRERERHVAAAELRSGSWEVTISGVLIGTLSVASGWLCLQFSSKSVKRKDVVQVLRSLTYSNAGSNVDSLTKLCKVTVNDGGQCWSESIIQIDIQEVDDITEIIIKNPRIVFRLQTSKPDEQKICPLAPFGSIWLEDDDTEWFTGGFVSIELIAGHSKYDQLAFMSVSDQIMMRKGIEQVHSSYPFVPEDIPLLELREDRSIVIYESNPPVVVGTLSLPKSENWAPSNNLKISFSKTPKIVSLLTASYCLSCISYFNNCDRAQANTRVYLITVSDGVNPDCGKGKVSIDVYSPIITNTLSPSVYSEDVFVKSDATALLCSKINVCWITQPLSAPNTKSDKKDVLQSGQVSLNIVSGRNEGDLLIIKKELTLKESSFYFLRDFAGKGLLSSDKFQIEFSSSTKLKVKQLIDILKTMSIKLGPGDDLRVVKIALVDQVGSCEAFVTVHPLVK